MKDAERQSCDKYIACLFILVADGARYQGLSKPWITSILWIRMPILRLCRRHSNCLSNLSQRRSLTPQLASQLVIPAWHSPRPKAICQHVLNVVQKDTQLTTALSLMLQGRTNSGLTEKVASGTKRGVAHVVVADAAAPTPAPAPAPSVASVPGSITS